MLATTIETLGAVSSSASRGTHVPGSGTANVKSAYVEFDASTSLLVAWLQFQYGYSSTNVLAGDHLWDLATGAAASEVDVINDMIFSSPAVVAGTHAPTFYPLEIATSTRLSIREQINAASSSAVLSITFQIAATLDIPGASVITSYGPDTSDSGGLQVDPGGTTNTKGSYSELSASGVALNYLTASQGARDNTAATTAAWLIDLATGAAASEVDFLDDWFTTISGNTDVPFGMNLSTSVPPIAATARLSVRAQCSINDATDRLLDVSIYVSDVTEPSGGETSHVF